MAERLSAPAALYFPETLFFCFWYSFLLQAEYIPGPSAVGRIMQIKKKCIQLIGSRTSDLPLVA
jgi:hypothetical protein